MFKIPFIGRSDPEMMVADRNHEYAAHQETQAIFASDLPSIPLYQRLKVAAARPDFCGFTLDPSSSSALADIESFDYAEGCGP